MRKFTFVVTIILTLVVFSAENLKAMPMYGKARSDNVWKQNSMFILNNPTLGLSQDQKDKIFNIHIQTKQKIDSQKLEIMKIRYEISKELSKDNPDFGKIKEYENQIAKIKSDIYLTRSNARLEIINLLTPDQRKKLKEMGMPGKMNY
ncbi:MAG: Spy/CpxP family protein refolding chaperone [Brevinematia bacterium]